MVKLEFDEIESANCNWWQMKLQSESLRERYTPQLMRYEHAVNLAKWWVLEMKETVELTFHYIGGFDDTRTLDQSTVLEAPPR